MFTICGVSMRQNYCTQISTMRQISVRDRYLVEVTMKKSKKYYSPYKSVVERD
jgi:hypothetical protein